MRCTRIVALILAGAALGGCVRSIQPILKEDQVIVDNALAGKWVIKSGKESAEVQPADGEKNYKVVYTDDDGKKAPLVARLGKVGDVLIAEFHPEEPAGGASAAYKAHLLPLYSFLLIRQTQPRLVVAAMSDDWLKKYLNDHPDELKIAKIDNDNFVVTSSTEEYQAFVLRHLKDKDAFGTQDTVFVRPNGDGAARD